ncbi:MAG TPA: ABC transporter ATP-binding protein [Solirubrobacteraceae bacterium]|jgi:putative ABC transport system ATP-binding protein|nr:ABC transporter ATP-binding protein [Solirubrobacteraceae bacterium]
MLELHGVLKLYRSGDEEVRAVDHVSLRLDAGEMLALQGPSGSGKTTLLLLAAAALRADAGLVAYRGRDLGALSEQERAQYRLCEIGLVAQNPHLMARVPAVENAATKLLLGGVPVGDARERALSWLERVGMARRAQRTPEELSGGERQRVAIARALAGDPQLILADEPTANLDSERSAEVVVLLGELAREHNKAVLLVTHDAEAAASADRVLRLRDGRVHEEASEAAPSP